MSTTDRKVLQAIHDLIAQHGYSPSFREIAAAASIGSVETIQRSLGHLRDLGLVTYRDGATRTVRLTGDGECEVLA